MPTNVVTNKKEERIWKRKVFEVEQSQGKKKKNFDPQDWALVNFLFQKAKDKYAGKRLPKKYQLHAFLTKVSNIYVIKN